MAIHEKYNSTDSDIANKLRIKRNIERQKDDLEQNHYGDERWADEFEKDLDNKNTDQAWDQYIDEHEKKNPKTSKDPKKKKKISARRRLMARKVLKKIRKERFDGLAFYSALFLAIFNDVFTILSNIFTAGAANVILTFTTEPLLGVILWRSGSSKTEMKIKRIGFTNVLGMVPIISAFPTHTLAIGYIKIQQNKKVSRLRRLLRKLRK